MAKYVVSRVLHGLRTSLGVAMVDQNGLMTRDNIELPSESSGQSERPRLATALAVSVAVLRISIGLVFIWFGALKIAGASPMVDVVHGATPWPDPVWFTSALGWVEVALGAFLGVGFAPLFVGAAFVLHMIGTGSVLVFTPAVAFQHGNPLMLTLVGEFVVKNAVLLAAGIVVVLWSLCRRQPKNSWRQGLIRES